MDETLQRTQTQLHASLAFHDLPDERRRKLMTDVAAVAAFLNPPPTPPRAGKGRPGVDRRMSTRPDMLPEYVSSLVMGTFQPVVEASVHQMAAYVELMASVAGSIEGLWADAEQRTLLAHRLEVELRKIFRDGD
ncbi:MAG TPA: hypothetical protein VGB85_18870 [Nannocystis sp.]|jgi:hypothetical protein